MPDSARGPHAVRREGNEVHVTDPDGDEISMPADDFADFLRAAKEGTLDEFGR